MFTLREQLGSVQTAILKIESGAQEYQIGTHRLTRADLKTLYDRETALKNAIASEESGDETGLRFSYARTVMR